MSPHSKTPAGRGMENREGTLAGIAAMPISTME
jgi:hypothetical protein